MCPLDYIRQNHYVQRVSVITWQRGGRGLAAGGAEELDVRGMKPASLPLLASSLEGKEPVRVNQSHAGSLLNSKSKQRKKRPSMWIFKYSPL